MEFYNCVVFVKETGNANGTAVSRREFTDSEWHYYALGNIGDSKKTDATRVNDPDDMKEFVVEISDNTFPNAAFQTGVYSNNGVINYNGTGTMVYPVTEAQWNNANNQARIALAYSFDGDGKTTPAASFEFRYDMGGETRDGETTGLSSEEQDAQRARNKQIFLDFYKWVVTASDEDFARQLSGWCIQESMLYWYLFTERYTMIDNRAKNTFWHFGDTGSYRIVPCPNSLFMDYYYELDEDSGEYTLTSDTSVVSSKTYYWRYAFEMWDYDNDTALGINNSGELTMTYGKEDTDYRTEGNASSGYIFNAAESTIWRRIKYLMDPQLRAMYQTLDSAGCWSAESLIDEFDNWQNMFPEEIWRLDIDRKYYRTYRGEGLNAGAAPSPTPRFLAEMMNGRKKYQRRQFERDQAAYMGTKYLSSTILADKIEFRCNTPLHYVVTPNYDLTIVPYSDMYISVKFGNTNPVQVRAKAGQSYTVECPFQGTMDDTMFVIYCASHIQALNDISACYIHDNDFSAASKLQTLVIGNTTDGYANEYLTTLNLGANQLLESLDIRNCPNLTGSLNLTNCSSLTTLRAEGTSITAVTFANYGKITNAYLPDSVNTLVMRNLKYLTNLSASLDSLQSLTLENSIVDEMEILSDTIDTLRSLRLVGIDWTLTDTTLLNQIVSLSNSYLQGSVYVTGAIRTREIDAYAAAWPDCVVTYDEQNLISQYLVTFKNDDAAHTVLYTMYVDRASVPEDPIDEGYIDTPVLPADKQYTYTFIGWDWSETRGGTVEEPGTVLADITVMARYSTEDRYYTVRWFSKVGETTPLLTVSDATYGSEQVYTGALPTNTSGESLYIFNLFKGWDKSTGYITDNIDVYAQWESGSAPNAGSKDLSEMSPGEIYAISRESRSDTPISLGDYFTLKDYTDVVLGNDYNFSNVESHEIVPLSAPKIYRGSTSDDFNYTLFEEDTSFTVAIDFEFSATDVDNTLFSCFDDTGNEGFRLRYNGNPQIQWGDQTVSFGSGKLRDIVVLRHIAGDNKMYVYASNATGSGTNFLNTILSTSSTRSRSTLTDQIITLGAVRYASDGGHDYYGSGTIHWCKLWMGDLGDTVCKSIAAWPRELLRMEYCNRVNSSTNVHEGRYRIVTGAPGEERVTSKRGISFIANNLLGDRMHQMNSSNTNVGGWDSSSMRTFCNDRIYPALPQVWRSMIQKVSIPASAGNKSTSLISSYDYVYIPSRIEMDNTSEAVYIDEGSHIQYFTSNYKRAKFRGVIVPDDSTYYSGSAEPSSAGNTVKAGDIWQPGGGSNGNYVAVSAADVEKYGLTGFHSTATTQDGAFYWYASSNWWLRSPFTGYTNLFWYVGTGGSAGNINYGSHAGFSYGVCPGFTI